MMLKFLQYSSQGTAFLAGAPAPAGPGVAPPLPTTTMKQYFLQKFFVAPTLRAVYMGD